MTYAQLDALMSAGNKRTTKKNARQVFAESAMLAKLGGRRG